MGGVTFRVGDWVRRKPEYQDVDVYDWPHGNSAVRVTDVHGTTIAVNDGRCEWFWGNFQPAEAPTTLDPHALGMALVLADELDIDAISLWAGVSYAQLAVADWLRAEVTRELLEAE
jgi:hypothetical protein